MQIKGMNGDSYNVTGQGQGTYNTVGASAGIASFLGLNAGNLLGGLWGNNCNNGWNRNVNCGVNACDTPVTRYEAAMMQELSAKDGKIALLESNIYTDSKIADVYERLNVKINANKAEQDAVNMQQAVYNGTNTATIACIKGQVAELASLSQLVVPSRNVCDTGCCNSR
jgi:hypothetical protein